MGQHSKQHREHHGYVNEGLMMVRFQTFHTQLHIYKRKKHFIKMLKDVGMVVPKIRETRL